MAIRKLQYQIDYVHILTFKDQYKDIVSPYFPFENVKYAIENENTIHESIRLIFNNEHILFLLNKQSIILLFEGPVSDLKNQSGPIRFFWDMYEKIKTLKNYTKTTRHLLVAQSVDFRTKDEVENILNENPYFTQNPFGPLKEFSCIYEFEESEIKYNINFGNYNKNDIEKQDLTPFKTDFNKDLFENVGLIGRIEANEKEKNPSYSKFKSLLSRAEQKLSKLNLLKVED